MLWLSRALVFVHELEKDTKHVSLAVDVDDEILKDRAKALKALKAVRDTTAISADVKKGVEILLSFGLLLTYGDDVKAYESLEVSLLCLSDFNGYLLTDLLAISHRTLSLALKSFRNPRPLPQSQKCLYLPSTSSSMS